jgi:hypothetical protein
VRRERRLAISVVAPRVLETGAGTRQRRRAKASRNIPDVAMLSDLPLIGFRAFVRSFVK